MSKGKQSALPGQACQAQKVRGQLIVGWLWLRRELCGENYDYGGNYVLGTMIRKQLGGDWTMIKGQLQRGCWLIEACSSWQEPIARGGGAGQAHWADISLSWELVIAGWGGEHWTDITLHTGLQVDSNALWEHLD